MKSYTEITSDLLNRRERYLIARKRKQKRILGAAAAACCCLILSIGIFKAGFLPFHNGETVDTPPASVIPEDRIVIHPIENIPVNKDRLNLNEEDRVEMTREELIGYYGVNYIPDVPDDIKPWPDEERGSICKRNGGTGEIYWDQNLLNFSSDGFERSVHLEVRKNGFPILDYLHFRGNEEASVINGTDVLIGLTESGYYYARFMYRDVGFVLDANGVSQDEFISIIRSLLD